MGSESVEGSNISLRPVVLFFLKNIFLFSWAKFNQVNATIKKKAKL